MYGREFLGCAALINILVEPGFNSTFTSALAFFRPKVSTTIIVMGVRIRLRDTIFYISLSRRGDWYISIFRCLGRRLVQYLSFFAVSAGDWSIVCSLCRDSTDFASFSFIFYTRFGWEIGS